MKRITIDERWLRTAAWVLVCGLITGGAVQLGRLLVAHGPEAPKAAPERNLPGVLVAVVEVTAAEIGIAAHGEVRPARRTTLSAEVGGRLVAVHESFEAGEVFAEGETLVQIDVADYNAALAAAEATLADAALALQLEESRRDQALRDWAKLGSGREPGDLVRRVPQLASAEAAVTAAQRASRRPGGMSSAPRWWRPTTAGSSGPTSIWARW